MESNKGQSKFFTYLKFFEVFGFLLFASEVPTNFWIVKTSFN